MNQVTHLGFKSSSVRIAFDANNEPLFCLADVLPIVGLQSRAIHKFQFDLKGVEKLSIPTNGGQQKLTFINESNLYRVIFRSNKPEALNFQNWVFNEVLPSIRKTGSYSARQTAYEELNHLCMQEKVSKEKGTFHSHGMHRRKHEKRLNALRINTCKAKIQLAFDGVEL